VNEPLPIWTFIVIAVTSVCSFIGFQNPAFCEKHLFAVREILVEKQYRRIVTSGFLHADWMHLMMNMVSLYLFGRSIEFYLGATEFLLIYFSAIIGGSLLSLWIHRNHEYRAYGASGGVCGMIFSYIALFPGASIASFPLPVPIPAWLYAILFFIGSFLALKRQSDNIGHDAHLGGAIIGMWTTIALEPDILRINLRVVTTISILTLLLFIYLTRNPLFLPLGNLYPKRWRTPKPPMPRNREVELDAILEKISRTGMESLTPEEKRLLKSTSEKYRRRSESKKPDSDLII
jgi:membrane associated rhomboid family serine protease